MLKIKVLYSEVARRKRRRRKSSKTILYFSAPVGRKHNTLDSYPFMDRYYILDDTVLYYTYKDINTYLHKTFDFFFFFCTNTD